MASSVYQNTGPPGRPPPPPPPGSHRQPPYASQQYNRNQGPPPPPLPSEQQAPPPPPPPPAQQAAPYPPPPGVSYPPPPPPGTSGPSTSGYGHHYPAPPPPSHYQQRYAPRQPSSSSYPASGYPPPPTYPASSSQPTSQFHASGRGQGPPSSWPAGQTSSNNAGPAPPSSRPFLPSSSQPQAKQGHRETEEERRERKRREYEMKKQRDSKSSQTQPVRSDKKTSASAAAAAAAADRTENRLKRNSTFLCKIKFRNELPDPVSQPKLLRIYNDRDRYSKYSITSLEKTYKHRLHVEPDLGIPLDLLDLSVYNLPKTSSSLDPADAELLVDDEVVVKQKVDNSRRKERPTDKGVAWLVKTTYISPVSADPAKPSGAEKQPKEQKELLESINDREQQIQAIEESFRVSKLPPVHQTKPELKPVEIWPLLPDFDRAGDKFVHLCFDTEPTGESEIYSKLDRGVRDYFESRAIMKSYTIQREVSKPEQFLAYMVPKPDEADDDEEDGVPYNWIREYNWDAPGDARSNYVFCFGGDAVRYLPLDARLTLHKKKAREGRSKDDVDNSFLVPSSVTVRRRELSDEEEEQRDAMRRNFMEGEAATVQQHTEDAVAAAGHSKRKRTGDERQPAPRHRRSYSEEDREMSDENEFI